MQHGRRRVSDWRGQELLAAFGEARELLWQSSVCAAAQAVTCVSSPFLSSPLLLAATHRCPQVCIITVGVIGDLCRALEKKLLPFCDDIIMLLLHDLQSNELDKSVKPVILSVFGDIALGLGGEFAKYLIYSAGMLQSAAEHSIQSGQKLDPVARTSPPSSPLRLSALRSACSPVFRCSKCAQAGVFFCRFAMLQSVHGTQTTTVFLSALPHSLRKFLRISPAG